MTRKGWLKLFSSTEEEKQTKEYIKAILIGIKNDNPNLSDKMCKAQLLIKWGNLLKSKRIYTEAYILESQEFVRRFIKDL